jgi:hypothetical protein
VFAPPHAYNGRRQLFLLLFRIAEESIVNLLFLTDFP